MHAVGGVAAVLSCSSFIPQIVRAYRTRSAQDLSWAMLATYGTGLFLWLLYSLMLLDPILIIANAFTLTNVVVLSWLKFSFRMNKAHALLMSANEGGSSQPVEFLAATMGSSLPKRHGMPAPAVRRVPARFAGSAKYSRSE
jgi:MtN3 and saliva related transmembrane protein